MFLKYFFQKKHAMINLVAVMEAVINSVGCMCTYFNFYCLLGGIKVDTFTSYDFCKVWRRHQMFTSQNNFSAKADTLLLDGIELLWIWNQLNAIQQIDTFTFYFDKRDKETK